MTASPAEPLRHTPLYEAHVALGGRMVPFAGYEMPVQYPSGIIKEHLHTRAAATLFDVSHMGQLTLRSRSGAFAETALALETLVPADILGLADGRQRYALFTDPIGGILDDLMVMRLGDDLRLVVNASRKHADEAHLRAHLSPACTIEAHGDLALLALQGPQAEAVLSVFAPAVRAMRFMDVRTLDLMGERCTISRSGYTGEDGFEISIAARSAQKFWDALLADGSCCRPVLAPATACGSKPACVSTAATSIPPRRRSRPRWNGRLHARAAPAAAAAVAFRAPTSSCARSPTGLHAAGSGCGPKAGHRCAPVPDCSAAQDDAPIGAVSSGGFSVSMGVPIAMGYVPVAAAAPGTPLCAELRGRLLTATVCALPFVPSHTKRD